MKDERIEKISFGRDKGAQFFVVIASAEDENITYESITEYEKIYDTSSQIERIVYKLNEVIDKLNSLTNEK